MAHSESDEFFNYCYYYSGHPPELHRSSSVISVTNTCDAIDLERMVFSRIAGKGELYLFKTEGLWSQIKTAGLVVY